MPLFARLAPSLVALIELVFVLATLAMIVLGRTESNGLRRLEISFGRLARRKMLSVLVVILTVLFLRAALIPVLGVPSPRWEDEFSYLLAADTFAHGRITNPTHPMWQHFETLHEIQQPTYMSMYPPAQGLVLAAGQRLGHPWIGQLFITAVMCGAICWMLQGWVPPGWALLGGMLAALRLGLLSYWMNGYWSSSVVALGGALVLGALPRIRRRARAGDAILMALGLAILANSRPYEGFVLSLPVLAAMLLWLFGRRHRNNPWLHVVLPIVLLSAITAVATGYYYHRVTGRATRMTYVVDRSQYAIAPYFLWQKPNPEPNYRHADMRDFYHWELSLYQENITPRGFLRRTADKISLCWSFYLGPLLILPLLAFPCLFRDRRMRFPLLALAIFIVGLGLEVFTFPHYFAPATCLLYLVLIQCMRHLRLWRWDGKPTGLAMVRAIPVLCLAMVILRVSAAALHTPIEPAWPRGNLDRADIEHRLQNTPGEHVIFVRYEKAHDPHKEWVYNSADIDASKVVWAHDMGEEQNQALLRYFEARRAWELDADEIPPKLAPYRAQQPAPRRN
jgi:hypothetical protein